MLAMSLDLPITQLRTFARSAATPATLPAAAAVVDKNWKRGAASPPWVYTVSVGKPCEFTVKLGDQDLRFTPLGYPPILTSISCTLAGLNELLPAVAVRCFEYEFGTSAGR